jgi:quinol monooxygenase YgiN
VIRHVVMWKLKNPADAPEFKRLLDSCAAVVPGILRFEVAMATPWLEANADVILVSDFADEAALAAYQSHPHHKAVGQTLGAMRETRSVLDWRVE